MQPYEPGSTDLELYGIGDDLFTGLEDFSVEDARLQRINIHHKDGGWFENTLTGEQFETIQFIPLAFVKQRIQWRPVMVDDGVPMCKSTDYKRGFPTLDEKDAKSNFQWAASGLNQADMVIDPENGRLVIPCEACQLKQWGTHPTKDTPWCAQQRTIPMLYGGDGAPPESLAVMTFQNTGLTPCNTFFAGISAKKIKGTTRAVPAYSVVGEISLSHRVKGTNEFQVPVFKKIRDTEMSDWLGYAAEARRVYEYLIRAPRGPETDERPDEDMVTGTGKEGYQPPASANPGKMAPPTGAQPTSVVEGSWEPTPPVQQAPVQQAPVQQAPVQQAPVQQAPVQQAPVVSTPEIGDPWASNSTSEFDDLPF